MDNGFTEGLTNNVVGGSFSDILLRVKGSQRCFEKFRNGHNVILFRFFLMKDLI